MASETLSASSAGYGKVSVLRFMLTGAIASGIFFALCWAGAFLPIGPATHEYLRLFTNAPLASGLGFAQGLCWSVVFGAVAGGLIGFSYNLLGAFEQR